MKSYSESAVEHCAPARWSYPLIRWSNEKCKRRKIRVTGSQRLEWFEDFRCSVTYRSPSISGALDRIDPMSSYGNGFSPGWRAEAYRFDCGDRSRSGSCKESVNRCLDTYVCTWRLVRIARSQFHRLLLSRISLCFLFVFERYSLRVLLLFLTIHLRKFQVIYLTNGILHKSRMSSSSGMFNLRSIRFFKYSYAIFRTCPFIRRKCLCFK